MIPPSTAPTGATRISQMHNIGEVDLRKDYYFFFVRPKSEGGGRVRQSLDYRLEKLKEIQKAKGELKAY